MTKAKKIWLAIIAFLPLVLIAFYILYIIWFTASTSDNLLDLGSRGSGERFVGGVIGGIITMIVLALVTAFFTIMAIITYMIRASAEKSLQPGERLIWMFVIALFSVIAIPAFWLLRIRTLPPPQPPPVNDF